MDMEKERYQKIPGLTELRKGILLNLRGQRIEKIYLGLLNEAWAMQIDLKDLLGQIIEIDKALLEEGKLNEKGKVQA